MKLEQRHDESSLRKSCEAIRSRVIELLHKSGGGHFGGALSIVELLAVLYFDFMPSLSIGEQSSVRDRFVLSKGHSAITLYVILERLGIISSEELSSYGHPQGKLPGHPDMLSTTGIEFSTGSLGQGLSAALGMAIALSKHKKRVWALIGDGECQEGQIWEAAAIASRYEISNLTAIVDLNGYQEFGWPNLPREKSVPLIQPREKWEAFGWHVLEIDGHNLQEIQTAYSSVESLRGKPSVILAKTIKGHGLPCFTLEPERSHCTTLTDLEYDEWLFAHTL